MGDEDAIIYLLHRAPSHLDKSGSTVRIMFLDFSSAFNTIQPVMSREKLELMQVDTTTIPWIMDDLNDRPLFVWLGMSVFDRHPQLYRSAAGDCAVPFPLLTIHLRLQA